MEISRNSDFILVLDIEDKKGEKIRVADVADFALYVYTTDPNTALMYTKAEIVQDADCDRVPIDAAQLEQLKSGVIRYTYSYATWNEDFTDTDEKYDKIKVVTTDVYFRNALSQPAKPANVVTYPMFLHLRDLINEEVIAREQGDNQIRHYVEVEYDNRLNAEIERSTGVDEAHAERISRLEENLDTEWLRASTIEKALDRRMDEIDNNVEILMGDDDVVGSVAHAVEDAKHYTDDEVAKIKTGYAKVSDLEAVEAKIPTVNHNLSAYHNDCGYISNTDILDGYYDKEYIDGIIDDIDIENIVRKDEVTVVKDSEGNVIHEMVLDPEPDYYTKEETDEIIAGLDDKFISPKKFNFGISLPEYDDDDYLEVTRVTEDFPVTGLVYNANFPEMGLHDATEFTGSKRVPTTGIYGRISMDRGGIGRPDLRFIVQCRYTGGLDEDGEPAYEILSVHTGEEPVDILEESDFIHLTFANYNEIKYRLYVRRKISDSVEDFMAAVNERIDGIDDVIDEKIGDIDFSSFETIEGAAGKYQPVGNYLTEHQSLENYYTKSEVDSKIDDEIGDIDFSSFETIEGAAGKYQPIGEYLTEHQSLSDYYTKAQVNNTISALKQPNNGQMTYKWCEKTEVGSYIMNGRVAGIYKKVSGNTYEYNDSNSQMRSVVIDITKTGDISFDFDTSKADIFLLCDNEYSHKFQGWNWGDLMVNPEVYTAGQSDWCVYPGDKVVICSHWNLKIVCNQGERVYIEETAQQFWKDHEKIGDIDFSSLETIDGAAEKYQPVGDYLTEHQSLENYYDKSEINSLLDGCATKASVSEIAAECSSINDAFGSKADKSSVYTKAETESKIAELAPEYDDTAIKSRISALEAIDHTQYLTEHQSLDNYYTKGQTDAAVTVKINDVKIQMESRIATLEEIDHDQYLTQHQSLENYYTKSQVDSKIDDVEVDLSDYYTKSEVDAMVPSSNIWFGSSDDAPALEDRDPQTLYIIV